MSANQMSQEAIRKAAILVVAMDAATADALLDKMGPRKAQQVRDAVMRLDDVSPAEEQAVLAEFLRAGDRPPLVAPDGVELDPSLVQRMAVEPTNEPAPATATVPPFHFLRQATTASLVRHLGNQHPQLIAVVLAHLPPAQAAQVIQQLSAHLQAGVLRRISELDMADPDMLEALEQQLRSIFHDEIRASKNRLHGVSAVNSILSAAGAQREMLMANLESHDRELAQLVGPPQNPETHPAERLIAASTRTDGQDSDSGESPRRRAVGDAPHAAAPQKQNDSNAPAASIRSTNLEPRFTFDDLEHLDDESLARLFAQCPVEVVLLALAGAGPGLLDRLLAQLPPKEARRLKQRIERVGPVRVGDIDEAQRQIAAAADEFLKESEEPQLEEGDRFAAAA